MTAVILFGNNGKNLVFDSMRQAGIFLDYDNRLCPRDASCRVCKYIEKGTEVPHLDGVSYTVDFLLEPQEQE